MRDEEVAIISHLSSFIPHLCCLPMAETRTQRKQREGVVVSDKMNKTVVVAVQRLTRHPLYGRVIRVTKKFKAHDESNECKVGDKVRIVETRPLSKEKQWRVAEVVEKAK
jgi:small subunit ribosomal protein S17